jgi:hypothetical protein
VSHFTLECEGAGIVGNEQIRTLQTSFHVKVLSSSLCCFLIKYRKLLCAVANHHKNRTNNTCELVKFL